MHGHPHRLMHPEPHAYAETHHPSDISKRIAHCICCSCTEAGTALPLHLAAGRPDSDAVFNLLQIANMIRHMLQNYSKVSRVSRLVTPWLRQ